MAGEDDFLFTTESRLRFGIPQTITGYVLDWSGVRFPALEGFSLAAVSHNENLCGLEQKR
jgi:hypothetical protein